MQRPAHISLQQNRQGSLVRPQLQPALCPSEASSELHGGHAGTYSYMAPGEQSVACLMTGRMTNIRISFAAAGVSRVVASAACEEPF